MTDIAYHLHQIDIDLSFILLNMVVCTLVLCFIIGSRK